MPSTMPTWSSPTSETSRANPGRASAPDAECPRSSSITSTRDAAQPSATARSASPYCNRVDSAWPATCAAVDWRTYTAASRSRCRDRTLPSARSQGSLAVTLTALTPAPAARRTHHPLDQQGQQTAREHPVDLRERLPCRRGCPRLPAQGGTAASPGTAHLPCPPRPAPHAAAGQPRPRPADRRFLGQEVPPGSIHLRMQSGLLLEHTFRLFKQVLGWTAPKIRGPAAADRWTWLTLAVYAQLRLARPLATDLRLPWERPA